MAEHPEILILGGGVIGLTTAYYLHKDGVKVEVVERGEFGGEASWAGAGILNAAPSRDRAATPAEKLFSLSMELFPLLTEDIRDIANFGTGYVHNGEFQLIADADAPAATRAWEDAGIGAEEMDREKLAEFEPGVKLPQGLRAFFLPDAGQVRNPRHLKGLLGWLGHSRVPLRPTCPVHGFEREGRRITGVKTPQGLLQADRYLIAAGSWTDLLLEQVGVRLGIHPVRGQIALLNTGVPILTRVLEWGRRYYVPRPDGRVLVGSTEELVGFDKRTTAVAVASFLTFACELVPALASAQVERCWAGLRPGSPDGLPFLGPVPGFDNLYVAAGHYRTGIQLSAATGLVMKELMLGKPTTVPLDAFRLDRPTARGIV